MKMIEILIFDVLPIIITLGFFTSLAKLFVKKIKWSMILSIIIYLVISLFFVFLTAFDVDFQVRPFVSHNYKVPQIGLDQLLATSFFWPFTITLGIIIGILIIISERLRIILNLRFKP